MKPGRDGLLGAEVGEEDAEKDCGPAETGESTEEEEEYDAALERWQLAKHVQHEESALSGCAFGRLETEGHLGKLARYEASIERALSRALHELQRLQAGRAGEPVSPPAALDVRTAEATP
jgi:hypothetical protein